MSGPDDPGKIGVAMPGMTAGQLRARLEGVPDQTPVTIRTNDDWDGAGGIRCAEIELSHDEDNTPHFAVDCSSDADDFDEPAATCGMLVVWPEQTKDVECGKPTQYRERGGELQICQECFDSLAEEPDIQAEYAKIDAPS